VYGNLTVVKSLIEDRKVDSSCQDEDGRIPLHTAARFGTLEVVKYLIEQQQCDMDCRDAYGNTTLHLAALGGKLDMVQYSDSMCRDVYGRTFMHSTCNSDTHRKVNLPCRDEGGGYVPLHATPHSGTLKVLLEEQQCNIDDDGNTPLQVAGKLKNKRLRSNV
jgi:ankyrin repeat protein